jgi:hypothetical protein
MLAMNARTHAGKSENEFEQQDDNDESDQKNDSDRAAEKFEHATLRKGDEPESAGFWWQRPSGEAHGPVG